MVSRWKKLFIEGRTTIHNELRSGRPTTSRTVDVVEDVQRVIDTDRRLTLDEILSLLCPNVELSRTSLCRIIFDDLGLSKVYTNWIPRLLTEQHKDQRVDVALKF